MIKLLPGPNKDPLHEGLDGQREESRDLFMRKRRLKLPKFALDLPNLAISMLQSRDNRSYHFAEFGRFQPNFGYIMVFFSYMKRSSSYHLPLST